MRRFSPPFLFSFSYFCVVDGSLVSFGVLVRRGLRFHMSASDVYLTCGWVPSICVVSLTAFSRKREKEGLCEDGSEVFSWRRFEVSVSGPEQTVRSRI